jgi:hypothetical protein
MVGHKTRDVPRITLSFPLFFLQTTSKTIGDENIGTQQQHNQVAV